MWRAAKADLTASAAASYSDAGTAVPESFWSVKA
jgi:hypothetical protein